MITTMRSDKPLKSSFDWGDGGEIDSVLESLIFNLLFIFYTLIWGRKVFNLRNDANGLLHVIISAYDIDNGNCTNVGNFINKILFNVDACCCLPIPMALASGGGGCLWFISQHLCTSGQQWRHSGGLCSQIQGWQGGVDADAVEEMMCVVYVQGRRSWGEGGDWPPNNK